MEATLLHLLKTSTPLFSGVVFTLLYFAEQVYPQRNELLDRQHDLKNMAIGILNLVIIFSAGYYFQKLITITNANRWGLLQQWEWNFSMGLLLNFILLDCFLYWWHRLNHTIPFLWKFHQFHHEDQKMNTTTALRFHFMELLLSYAIRFLIFPLLGFSLSAVLLHGLVLFPVLLLHHSNIKLHPKVDYLLRFILVTPAIHRVHHSKEVAETNSNYGAILPYWDRIFSSLNTNYRNNITFGI